MAFKSTYNDYTSRKQTIHRNQQPQNRRCTNCSYYRHEDVGYVCARESYNGVIYRMPPPDIAHNKVCSHYYPSPYKKY